MFIAISLCFTFAGSALASDPQPVNIDRHSVWTNWIKEDPMYKPTPTYSHNGNGEHSKTETMNDKVKEFDFLKETSSYDYEKETNKSS